MALLMENKEKAMNDNLLILKFTVSKGGLKLSQNCHKNFKNAVLISTIHYITEMISTHCMSGYLRHEVFWPLSPFSHLQFCQPDRNKQFITTLLSKNYTLTKTFQEKSKIWSTGFSKQKTNFLTTFVTVFFISNKTHCSDFNWRKCRGQKVFANFKICGLL